MKTIELEQVKNQLLAGVAEFETNHVAYYLHVTEDGEIVSDAAHADETFIYVVQYEHYGLENVSDERYNEIQNTVYSHEVDGDEIFSEVVRNLCSQANKWLKEV